jgi:hypothetical protein
MNAQTSSARSGVGRRGFLLGASALGAAVTAAWGARVEARTSDEPSPAWRSLQNTTHFTLFSETVGTTLIDTSPPGPSIGDLTYYYANLRLQPGAGIVGRVFGRNSVVAFGTSADPELGPRLTHLVFVSNDLSTQLVVDGIVNYPVSGAEFAVDQPVFRSIVGGTGLFLGARGELTTTRLATGGYRQDFTLLG